MRKLKIIDCPRDAMQSIKEFIPTEKKVKYIQSLVEVGFDTIDMGSFVSKKVIPQLSDTGEVIDSLDLSNKKSDLLVIIANIKGAEIAAADLGDAQAKSIISGVRKIPPPTPISPDKMPIEAPVIRRIIKCGFFI